jgi:ubiquinone/menaquinone biosynthesis C-methylase UbiE
VDCNDPTPDAGLQRKYRVRIALFFAIVLLCVFSLSAIYAAIRTVARLDVVEAERDQWQRPSDVVGELKLKDGKSVADVGSGSGYFVLKLSHAVGSSGRVFAVDIRRRPLVILWMRTLFLGGHNIRLVLGDQADPHLPAGSLDAALIANTYHEFASPASTVDHLYRALRNRGRLVVLDRSAAARGSDEGQERHQISPDDVEVQLRQAGLKILNRQDHFIDRPNGERWWLIVAQKARQ